jgi:hypothetical protein
MSVRARFSASGASGTVSPDSRVRRHRLEGRPILDAQHVAGMTGTQEHQARDEAAGLAEQLHQFLAGETVGPAVGAGQFQEVQVAVAAPVDDVIALAVLHLGCKPLAGDAVHEEIGLDAAVGVDFLPEQFEKAPPLQPRRQRRRAGAERLGEHEQHPQGFVLVQFRRGGRFRVRAVDRPDDEIPLRQRRLVRCSAGDFPGHTGQGRRQVIGVRFRAGQLHAERPVLGRLRQLGEDVRPQDFRSQAHAQVGHQLLFAPPALAGLGGIGADEFAEIEESLDFRGVDPGEIDAVVTQLAVLAEQAQFGGEGFVIRRDDEVEARCHDWPPSIASNAIGGFSHHTLGHGRGRFHR